MLYVLLSLLKIYVNNMMIQSNLFDYKGKLNKKKHLTLTIKCLLFILSKFLLIYMDITDVFKNK